MTDRPRGRRMDRRRLLDLLVGRFAALGGAVLILTILSVFAVVMWVIYPLFTSPAEYRWGVSGTNGIDAGYPILPLISGTLKGAVYSLLFAVPVSVLAALYASQFLPRALKERLKPLVEIMAAVPSVVLGFIGGVWLAPFLASHVFALFLAPVFIAGAVVAAFLIRHHAPVRFRAFDPPGREIWLLLVAVLAGGWLALECGALLKAAWLRAGYETWFEASLGLAFAERNAIVVGMVMGLAVTPIIFTLSEEALSTVPRSFLEGSMSLGATRWQTAVRIVLPAAGSGILAAVLLGFSRAIGETMIVLFISGNVPVMDWSAFTGFRALSASVALDLPNAARDDTLYRVLFFAAFLLLVSTFAINTAAELVRRRLRRRYA
ncbi:MAG: ABC transporter permease subunit [Gemmatimonadetes bacterium]|nr:ABC transporter permease subunit [Gemmatimonadota bacterium]